MPDLRVGRTKYIESIPACRDRQQPAKNSRPTLINKFVPFFLLFPAGVDIDIDLLVGGVTLGAAAKGV